MRISWRPTPERIEHANATRLLRRVGMDDWWEFVRLSAEQPEWFWPIAVEDMELEFAAPWTDVCDSSAGPEWSRWFVGATVNVAHNCVHRWAKRRPDAVAIVGYTEDGARRELRFREFAHDVTRLAEHLLDLGVRSGDHVGIYLPMTPDAAVASHAIAHIGAVQVPLFSGFAAPALAERLHAAEISTVITTGGSTRRGRLVPMLEILNEALRGVPSVKHVVVAPFELDPYPGVLDVVDVDSEHPYLIAYTSGTTGRPKGVVHVQGGFLVSVAREACYAADVHEGDVLHFVTDMGWLMGPWTLVGAGALGATLVLAEGAPDWPQDRLWQLIERESISILGVSPTLIRVLCARGANPPTGTLSSLQTFVTTGEPWNAEPYRWLFETIGRRNAPIINISGGTEVGACFLGPTPIVEIKECSVGGPVPGMAMDVVDADGCSLIGTGEVGELVCRRPFPGMTRGFLHEPDRYLETYWNRLPGVWMHGDWASVDADGAWFLHGRSDETLNISGKRIGPAEIESAAVSHEAVAEAAAVAMHHDVKGETPWLFCVLRPGYVSSDQLENEIADRVAAEIGKAFRPERVICISALPKTRSAKIVRRLIRAAASGADRHDRSSLENPEALDEIASAARPRVASKPFR